MYQGSFKGVSRKSQKVSRKFQDRRQNLAEEIWQIAEGFMEVPTNLYAVLKKCGMNDPNY